MNSTVGGNCFVTLEGGEGAGKSSLSKRLSAALLSEGYPVLATQEPGATALGRELRQLLLEEREVRIAVRAELCLFLADRSQHLVEKVIPALGQGKVVVCDRFNLSTIAYQGAGRELGCPLVKAFCEFVCGGLEPMRSYYLDVEPEIGLRRARQVGGQDCMEAEDLAFHKRIRCAFQSLAKADPDRVVIVDAGQDADTVFQTVYKDLKGFVLSR